MEKIAFLFSGQGSQYVGMGRDICEKFQEADLIYDAASKILSFDVKEFMWNGNLEEISKTENAQPCIFVMCNAILEIFKKNGIKPNVTAGFSLGEYSANVASGTISFHETLKIVKLRGKFMQEEVPLGVGGMMAISSSQIDIIEKICKESSVKGIVEPANFNCPGQTVISGENEALNYAKEISKEMGLRCKILPVSAPFHSKMLLGAAKKLSKELEKLSIQEIRIPIISNVTADYIKNKDEIVPLLIKQVYSCVRFEETLNKMLNDGTSIFVEIGPGKTLSGFVKKMKTDREIRIFNTNNVEDLIQTLKALKGEFQCQD